MNQYWVYMLRCADGTYYTGITGNIERRVAEHELGTNLTCYTFLRRPIVLVYTASFNTPEEAIRWEKRVKGWSHRKKSALIRNDWKTIQGRIRYRSGSQHDGPRAAERIGCDPSPSRSPDPANPELGSSRRMKPSIARTQRKS